MEFFFKKLFETSHREQKKWKVKSFAGTRKVTFRSFLILESQSLAKVKVSVENF